MREVKQAGRDPADEWRFGCNPPVRRMLIKPLLLRQHLEGGKGLLGLIVLVQVPGKIGDHPEKDRKHQHPPEGGTTRQEIALNRGGFCSHEMLSASSVID